MIYQKKRGIKGRGFPLHTPVDSRIFFKGHSEEANIKDAGKKRKEPEDLRDHAVFYSTSFPGSLAAWDHNDSDLRVGLSD